MIIEIEKHEGILFVEKAGEILHRVKRKGYREKIMKPFLSEDFLLETDSAPTALS